MLTEDITIEKKEKAEYPPLPKDIYQAQILDVTAVKKPSYDTRNKPEAEQIMEVVLNFQFTLLEGKDGDNELRGRNVWANFVPTYLYIGKNGKNKLYRITEAVLGAELTLEEEAKMDKNYINGLIGKQVRISVEPSTKGDNTYDNITDWLKINNEMTPLTDEEKESAEVKNKDDEQSVSDETSQPKPSQNDDGSPEIDVDSIPF
jgi:hypothetical protein